MGSCKIQGRLPRIKKDLEDGYIHFSEEFQVTGTLEKFFKGQENLLLLKVNTDKL